MVWYGMAWHGPWLKLPSRPLLEYLPDSHYSYHYYGTYTTTLPHYYTTTHYYYHYPSGLEAITLTILTTSSGPSLQAKDLLTY